ncbi:MAG TPA: hydrogenase [Aquifex aeolicus]|uniref:Hydrogenase n=1 Tax=Aquifex aeolicus TaxID=63363 RepID=A0A9D1CF38_AQUAO|nr:hydrogenase [Aquificales bacterium]HIP86511.1 hydrogenase [Aquifex sp.]HIP97991.1 hydrogenase [Aquifex aeolicus]HIQ26862.1 hydrogenase [Aquifex aeolicus]
MIAAEILASILLPWISALVIYVLNNHRVSVFLTVLNFVILTIIGLHLWFSVNNPITLHPPHLVDWLLLVYDYGLLLYFFKQGIENRNPLVSVLAVIQIFLLSWVVLIRPHSEVPNIYIDKLTVFMYLIVGFVGSLITLFATRYMQDENPVREGEFVAILVWFLGVMNFIVSVNNIEWFFALFETTTLASYLLIRFRGDTVSVNNALLALWMNQIGGITILLALLFAIHKYGITHFSQFGEHTQLALFPLAFLSAAALVKGAQMPFHRWLLGAMVAPTPVSAILHSATMVKVAPYLILRLSPFIKGTLLAKLIVVFTGFVFVVTALLALNETHFKRILAYSTISLLSLMMLAGTIGTPITITVALMLIAFHAVAKALLFLEAGVLEKRYHAKTIYDLKHIINKAPLTVFFILVGFLSMTMVPFAMFVAKWLMISEMSELLSKASYIITVAILAIGGAILTVLYLKILGLTINRDEESFRVKIEKLPSLYTIPNVIYVVLILIATLFINTFLVYFFAPITQSIIGYIPPFCEGLSVCIKNLQLPFWQIIIAFFFVVFFPIIAHYIHFKTDRTAEYSCGEPVKPRISTYNMVCLNKVSTYFESISLALFVLVLVIGGGML